MEKFNKKYKSFLENLSPSTLNELKNYVTIDVHFKDPFNDVIGVENMHKIFQHMFSNVKHLSFTINNEAVVDRTSLMSWTFSGAIKNNYFSIEGTSVILFSDSGLVIEHIDYWDAAQNVYERIPIFGRLIALLRNYLAL